MIELRNISKDYVVSKKQTNTALKNTNLVINDGEFVALLGPSGCGKTTTLMIIAGLLKPTNGEVLFDGVCVNDVEPKDRGIGMVFQSYALYPHLKVRDNIAFPLKQQGIPKAERYARVEAIAKIVQLENLLDRKPTQLSGGQQQRVAMARALCKQPRILLLDEPMSNLDARLKVDVRDEIRSLQQELNLTTLIVTHDQEEAMAIADRIAILDAGEVQQFDTPDMLFNHPANILVANFMGNPPMNIVKGTLRKDESGFYLEAEDYHLKIFGNDEKCARFLDRPVALGIRPGNITPCGNDDPERQDFYINLVEHQGDKYLVKMLANANSEQEGIRMVCPNYFDIKLGMTLPVIFNSEKIHLFDLEDGGKTIE